jgi:16S rRNA (guanine527-N7)-methyltransferase
VPATDNGGHSPIDVLKVLGQSQDFGFLGPGPLGPQQAHAQGFTELARRLSLGLGAEGPRILDLGSGGGLPGLVVAEQWPEASLVLLDGNERRTTFLTTAVITLGFGSRVTVINDRAESAAHRPDLRGSFDGVVARSFGPPGTLAECGAPFLRVGGWLVVSEPPVVGDPESETDPTRWPAAQLEQFGLVPEEQILGEFTYQVLRQAAPCPERFPRRNGVPAKRPLF